jgi:hypothetical protein
MWIRDTWQARALTFLRNWAANRVTPKVTSQSLGDAVYGLYKGRYSPSRNHLVKMIKSLGLVLLLLARIYAQSDLTVDVGGWMPPITSPQVMGFNGLAGPYKHVVFLSIDGLHQVYLHVECITDKV